ncbi:MAG: Rrf2 family transcriptional regulator [Alphaproteobacteria bacterium]|nr:Rrf2 family transcriptional regulator [Alphaproteobacteria bacterium]
MRLSTRGRYAVMAMVELAAREARAQVAAPGRKTTPVSLAEIAASQMISLAYLEQLFGPLRRAELVLSARGPGGGYRLARAAHEITISQVVDAVEESIRTTRCEDGMPNCAAGQQCRTHDLWAELGDHIRFFLDGLTLADVLGETIQGRASGPKDLRERILALAAQ